MKETVASNWQKLTKVSPSDLEDACCAWTLWSFLLLGGGFFGGKFRDLTRRGVACFLPRKKSVSRFKNVVSYQKKASFPN